MPPPQQQQSTGGPVVPEVAFLEWKDGSDIQCPASACQNSFFAAGATQIEEEVECCLQICAERGFYVTQEAQFDYIFDIEPVVVRPSQYCDCLEALVGRGTFLSSSIRGSFDGEMVPGDGTTRWNLYREEGGSSLALQFDLGAPDRICTGVFLVKAGEILGVDETAFLESPLFLASQYNMWHIGSDASTILWTDFYDDVHMTFDNTVYNLEECMVPAAVFKNEYMTLSSLSSFSWALWVFLLVVGILWLLYFVLVTAAHRLLLHDQYRGSVVLWGAWDIAMWLQILVQACKCMVYIDLLNKGASFDLWYPNLDGLQVDFAWLVRGFEQNAFERGYLQAELLTPSASDAFKAGVWGQLFLVGFNIARYVGLDWARKLAPPGARFLDRVVGLVVGFVCGLALLVQPALQLALYSVALRFQLARTSRFPLTAVDVAPEVFLTGVSVVLSAVLVLNTVRIGVAGYFPLCPLSQRKDRRQGFRNFRTGMFGVMGGCDQNFSDTTGKFVFFRLLNPIGLGPFASLVGIVVLAAPCALKAHILSVAGTESLFCAWDGAVIDAVIGVCVLFLIGMVVIQFMCFSACRN